MECRRRRLIARALILTFLVAGMGSMAGSARGQEGAAGPSLPEGTGPDGPDRLARIEEQLQKLESHNQKMQQRYDDLSRKYQALLQQSSEPVFGARAGNADGKGIPGGVNLRPTSLLQQKGREQTGEGGAGVAAGAGGGQLRTYEQEEGTGEEAEGGGAAREAGEGIQSRERVQSGTAGPGVAVETQGPALMADYVDKRGPYVPDMRPLGLPGSVSFREGLEIRAADDFFTLEFHNLSQFDYRDFSVTGDALHDNFIIPRQRWYFQGQVSPYATYYTVINRGYGALDILDSWVDFNFAPQYKQEFQVRAGRMKTPFTYEYIKISESDLIAPERSLFITNFADNRQDGFMAHGYLFQRSLEYYAGIFNGPRRSFVDFNNSKDLMGLFNWKPFLLGGPDWLKQLNLTGSVNGGSQHNPTQPVDLTTANDQSTATSPATANVSPTFLIFNNRAIEDGTRLMWAADVAYYYKSFTMLSNIEGGYQSMALSQTGTLPSTTAFGPLASGAFVGQAGMGRRRVPLAGWSVAATYFLTGEQITRRVYLTEPIRPFGYYNGRLNPGAIEVYSRFSNLQLGDEVFTGGFANPALWANRVSTTDTGVNWYLNHYVRIYFDWQHAFYNKEVFMSDNKFTRHNDLYWLRTQVFF